MTIGALKLALIAAAAVGGLAKAQTPPVPAGAGNVTLFGVVDVFAGKLQYAGQPNTTVVNPGGLMTSRWGVTGSEDLGDGLRANFNLASLFRPDSGAPGRFNGDAFFSSRSTVGLSGGFGQVNVGRMNSPLFFTLLRFDPHELGGITPVFLHTFPGGQPLVAPQLVSDSAVNDSIQYATPSIAGFTGAVQYGVIERAGKSKGRLGWGVSYASGPLAAGLAGDSINAPLPTGERHQTALAGAVSYDFKVVKLAGIHQIHKQEALGNEYRIDTLGATIPAGPHKVLLSWTRTRLDRATGVDASRTTFALTYDHFLSRRTDLYLHAMVDRASTAATRGTTLVAGVRHRF